MSEEGSSLENKPLYNKDLRKSYEGVRSVVNKSIDKSIESGAPTSHKLSMRKSAYFSAVEAKKESLIDPLTNLYNLRGFRLIMNEEVNIMKREKTEGVLVALDVNGLKEINDSLGHLAGDKMIVDTAEALKEGSRSVDPIAHVPIARCGDKADEFKVILTKSDIKGATVWWNRVNKLLTEKGVKIAAGVTKIDINNPEKSIDESDKAMYTAKEISKKTGENLMVRYDRLNPE